MSGGLTLSTSFFVTGISDAGNLNPKHPTRNITFFFYTPDQNGLDPNAQPVFVTSAPIFFNNNTESALYKLFTNPDIIIPTIQQGQYTIWVKADGFPKQALSDATGNKTFSLTPGQTITLPTTHFISGDIAPFPNTDNISDTNDYTEFIGCYGNKVTSSSCHAGYTADFNDDGSVDQIDYNIFLINFNAYATLYQIAIPTATPAALPTIAPKIIAITSPTTAVVSPAITIEPTPVPPPQQSPIQTLVAAAENGIWWTTIIDILAFLFMVATIVISIYWTRKTKKEAENKKREATQKEQKN